MEALLVEITGGLPDLAQLLRVTLRLIVAALLGAVIGYERESAGKAAGLRTHMLVSLGAALFVIGGLESGMDPEDISRVIQGLATGIGFVGAGAILKLDEERQIRGLTTAAGIWLTAAVGVAAGLGRLAAACVGVMLTWIILVGLVELERRTHAKRKGSSSGAS